MNVVKFHDQILVPALQMPISKFNDVRARHLLLGTAMVESGLNDVVGDNGQSLSWFQINELTYRDIMQRFLPQREFNVCGILQKYYGHYLGMPSFDVLRYRLDLAVHVARLVYYKVAEPLPDYSDIKGQAAYWKQYYNTKLGAGTEQKYVDCYTKFILPFVAQGGRLYEGTNEGQASQNGKDGQNGQDVQSKSRKRVNNNVKDSG